VDYALSRKKCVLVVSEPHVAGAQREQQAAIAEMLGQRFSGRPRLRYVDLGHAVDVHDPELAFDGMHLTAVGSARIAERLVEPVLELLRAPGSSCRDTTRRGE
jgi:lysophospholipase L1-like esterase